MNVPSPYPAIAPGDSTTDVVTVVKYPAGHFLSEPLMIAGEYRIVLSLGFTISGEGLVLAGTVDERATQPFVVRDP